VEVKYHTEVSDKHHIQAILTSVPFEQDAVWSGRHLEGVVKRKIPALDEDQMSAVKPLAYR
jgi:hypothetical protein